MCAYYDCVRILPNMVMHGKMPILWNIREESFALDIGSLDHV